MNSVTLNRLVSEDVFYKAVMGLILGMPVLELVTEILFRITGNVIPSSFEPVMLALFGIAGTILTVLYFILSIPLKQKLRSADIFYLTLVFFMIISAVFSLNPGVFSGGDFNRCEHPLHFLAYYWLFFAGSLIDDPKYRKNILLSFLAVAVLESIFAFLQTFNIELAYCYLYRADRSAYGLTQNSNYYGGLCVTLLACVSGLYIFFDSIASSKVFRFALPAISAFLFYTMIGSRARLAWVGFAALIIFYVISFIVMCRKAEDKAVIRSAVKRSLILVGAFFIVFWIAFFFTDYIREVSERSYWEVANGNVEMMGSRRTYVWKMGLESVPKNWLTGVGLDNFEHVFTSNPDFQEGMYMKDKAHNEYIQILVTQGIPALINYLALLIYTCVGAVKNVIRETSQEKRAITWILLGMFIAYISQAIFNNSITYVAMNFWLVLGLLIPRSTAKLTRRKV